jgi:hypothetical protein
VEIMNHANHLSGDVRRADRRVQKGWRGVEADLRRTAQALGVRCDSYMQPRSPVPIYSPSWGQLPFSLGSRVGSVRNQNVIDLADQFIDRVDSYVSSLQPLARRRGDTAAVIGSLQDLKHSALAVRQAAASGAVGSPLFRSTDALMSQYKETAGSVVKMVAADPSLNSPVFYQLGELAQQLRNAARGSRP